MVRTAGAAATGAGAGAAAGAGAGAKAGAGAETAAGAGAGAAMAGPVRTSVWPGTMMLYWPRPFAASMAFMSTPNRPAIAPTVSPGTTVYWFPSGAAAGAGAGSGAGA